MCPPGAESVVDTKAGAAVCESIDSIRYILYDCARENVHFLIIGDGPEFRHSLLATTDYQDLFG